jgi:hypothetical protein
MFAMKWSTTTAAFRTAGEDGRGRSTDLPSSLAEAARCRPTTLPSAPSREGARYRSTTLPSPLAGEGQGGGSLNSDPGRRLGHGLFHRPYAAQKSH